MIKIFEIYGRYWILDILEVYDHKGHRWEFCFITKLVFMIVSPCCRIIRSCCGSNRGTFHSRLAALCPSYIRIPNSHARIFVTKSRKTNRPSSFIFDTKEARQRNSDSSTVGSDLDEILKDQTPSAQLRLVDAYRRGFQSSADSEKSSTGAQIWRTLIFKTLVFGVVSCCTIMLFKKTLGKLFVARDNWNFGH